MGFKRVFHKTCLVIRKHSPQILAVAGAISTIAGVVLVCKTATETAEEVNQAKDEIQQIKDSIESEAVDKKDGKKSMHAIMNSHPGHPLSTAILPIIMAVSVVTAPALRSIRNVAILTLIPRATRIPTPKFCTILGIR